MSDSSYLLGLSCLYALDLLLTIRRIGPQTHEHLMPGSETFRHLKPSTVSDQNRAEHYPISLKFDHRLKIQATGDTLPRTHDLFIHRTFRNHTLCDFKKFTFVP